MADAAIRSTLLSSYNSPPANASQPHSQRLPRAMLDGPADQYILNVLGHALCEWENGPRAPGENRGDAAERIRMWILNGDTNAQLWLGGLGLTSLPSMLPEIRDLDLSNNALEHLPDHLPCSIVSLDVAGNALTTLPTYLPPRLQHLDVSYNKIKQFPRKLPNNLSHVIAHHNLLKSLPADLSGIALEKLDVSANTNPDLQPIADKIVATLRIRNLSFPRINGQARLSAMVGAINGVECNKRHLALMTIQSDRANAAPGDHCTMASRTRVPLPKMG